MKTTRTGAIVGLLTLAAGVTAQADDALIIDGTNNRIYRTQDLDGDSLSTKVDEVTLFVDVAAVAGDVITADTRVETGGPAVYWSGGFAGSSGCSAEPVENGVWRAIDLNCDGVCAPTPGTPPYGPSEITFFWDATADGFDIDPDGLALGADGKVWLSSDFDCDEGIWYLEDKNGSGDVNDDLANERFYVVGPAGVPVSHDGTGTTVISADDFQYMSSVGNAIIVYEGFSSTAGSGSETGYFRFEDMNNDGDVLDGLTDGTRANDEARSFLNYTGTNAGLGPANPDFNGIVLRDPEIGGGGGFFVRLWHNGVGQDSTGTTVYYFGSEVSAANITFNTNVNGLGLNGLIFKGIDGNGDLDVNDAGEVKMFYDGSHTSGLPQIDKILGMQAVGEWLYVLDLAGHAVHRFRDVNLDGDAMDAGLGEFEFDIFDDTYDPLGTGTMVIPFVDSTGADLPLGFITDMGAMPASRFLDASNYHATEGIGCATFGADPKIRVFGHANINTATSLTVQLTDTGTGAGAPAFLYFGNSNTTLFGAPILPLDMTTFGYPGCFIYNNQQGTLGPAFTNPSGVATRNVAIPNKTSLIGKIFFFQWIFLSATPSGVGVSPNAAIEIEM